MSAVLLLNRACCSAPTEPVVATSDVKAKKCGAADGSSSAHAYNHGLEARARVSGSFFEGLATWFNAIMDNFS